MRKKFTCIIAALIFLISSLTGCGGKTSDKIELINVSYDPTREFYEEYNALFAEYWKEQTGSDVEIIQSHGGSAKQALEVANGLEADVVTLALEADVDSLVDEGLIESGWIDEYDEDSAPYTSTICFLVRKGNPKNIQDWDDLVRDDVGVITPNPKTSGGARWNYMAAWAYAQEKYNGNENQMMEFMKKLYSNVLVLDSGARGATTSFIENQQGDVLVAWENEAYLSMLEYGDGEYEIITPSISILAQPSVAVVDEVVDEKGTRDVASAYLSLLYSDEAQEIAAKNYYRPTNQDILNKYSYQFDLSVRLYSINDFGGWSEVQKKHFDDGGIFDRIYE
jgi:sulfate transport system substrate-binding protein